jgi:starch synthase (maltosyl-transferring)
MTVGKHVGLHNYCFANYAFDRESAATGWVDLDLRALGLEADHAFQVHDLLGEGRYLWQGSRNYVELTPESLSAHILRVRR